MKGRKIRLSVVVLLLLSVLVSVGPALSEEPQSSAVERLQQDARDELEITWAPDTDTPSFIRGRIAVATLGAAKGKASQAQIALAVAERYADVFGVRQAYDELRVVREDVDALGMRHVTLGQVYQGVEVYDAYLKVHLSADGREVVAIGNGFVPDVALPTTEPRITADQARTAAQKALPNGLLLSGPKLVVYAGAGRQHGASARLAWLVELRDDSLPARNVYVLDALNGMMLDVLNRLYDRPSVSTGAASGNTSVLAGAASGVNAGRVTSTNRVYSPRLKLQQTGRLRQTYTANHKTKLPGTLARSEGQGPTGDQDVDNAHDFAGATYDYYWSTHQRDSYDGQGATLISTAHYGEGYENAFWNGEQMVYGDGFPVKDVAAHELTHAVTEYSANLEYRWQSGALNESFSDIFGAMVDREDWLIGEDLPPSALAGREAVRDMANPPRFGQPDHTRDWLATCSDEEGVHTNSGITNKAYYNIATAIGKTKAERIFYRTLNAYLLATSSLEDARAGALQSAQDLYGNNSAEYTAVRDGFNAVGLDGAWQPPENDCLCAITTALSQTAFDQNGSPPLEVATTLYRVRDQLLSRGTAGPYYRALYEQHKGRAAYLLLRDSALRSTAIEILQEFTPGLGRLTDGQGREVIVTPQMITQLRSFLQRLAEADQGHGGGRLMQAIEQELDRLDLDRLAGMTFEEAWAYVNGRVDASLDKPL